MEYLSKASFNRFECKTENELLSFQLYLENADLNCKKGIKIACAI